MEDQPDRATLERLDELHREMEELAAASRWSDVDALLTARNRLLADVNSAERPAALEAAHRSTDRILALARDAQLEVAGQLASLKRGREATAAYQAHVPRTRSARR